MTNFKAGRIVLNSLAEVLISLKIDILNSRNFGFAESSFDQSELFRRAKHLSNIIRVVNAYVVVLTRTLSGFVALQSCNGSQG